MTVQIFFNLLNHPTFHSEERLVNICSKKKRVLCWSVSIISLFQKYTRYTYIYTESLERRINNLSLSDWTHTPPDGFRQNGIFLCVGGIIYNLFHLFFSISVCAPHRDTPIQTRNKNKMCQLSKSTGDILGSSPCTAASTAGSCQSLTSS